MALAVGCLVLVFWLTQPLVDRAQEFLGLLGQGKVHEAYETSAQEFKEVTSEEEFTQFIQRVGLDEPSTASWSSREIDNDRGELSGTVTNARGDKLPTTVFLLHLQGGWKVAGIHVGSE
ncbi:MAG: hypothetical protein HY319_20810 [Armatimonadetes bacterium]|nr:hypothetical protein [Armatimonadota bacterium]